MMDEPVTDLAFPGKDRHLQRVQGQARTQMLSDLPADNLAGEQVSDECRVRKSASRVHIGDISDPATIRRGRGEVPLQQVSGPHPAASGTVVRGFFRLAAAPARPSSLISRATVHRATSMPSRRSCRHTFRAPYTRRPFLRSSHTRLICSFSRSSRTSRGDGSRSRFFAA
jgi:hypothetical protein